VTIVNPDIGRFYLSPDDNGAVKPDEGKKAGEEQTPAPTKKMTVKELSEMTLVDDDGKDVSGKEFTESRRRKPDLDKTLADERKKLEDQRTRMEAEYREREKQLTETAKSASNESLNRVVDALLEASGRKARSTALTRDEKVAFVNDVMANNGWNAGVDALVRDIYDADTSAAEANKKVAELERKLADMEKKAEERDEKATQAEVLALEREEARIVKGIYPGYDANRRTRDARSMAIQGLLVDDEPDQEILGGLIGNKTAPDVIAKKVLTFYATAERDRVKAEDEAEKKRKDTEAVTTLGRSSFALSDDLETELAKADTPKKLAEVRRKIAAAQRGEA